MIRHTRSSFWGLHFFEVIVQSKCELAENAVQMLIAPTHRTIARVFVDAFLAAQTRVFGDSAKEAVGTLSFRAVRVDSRIQIEQIREDKWHSKMPQSCRGLVGKCGAFAQCLGRWIFSSKSGFLIVATDTKTEVHQERTFVIWPDQKLKGSVS